MSDTEPERVYDPSNPENLAWWMETVRQRVEAAMDLPDGVTLAWETRTADDEPERYEAAAWGLRTNLHAMIDADMPQPSHLKTAITGMADHLADAVERPTPFREMRRTVASPACYEASWGWVHSRPSCRCVR